MASSDVFLGGDNPFPRQSVFELDDSSQDSGYGSEEDSTIASPASYFKPVGTLQLDYLDDKTSEFLTSTDNANIPTTASRDSQAKSEIHRRTCNHVKRQRVNTFEDTSPVCKRRKGFGSVDGVEKMMERDFKSKKETAVSCPQRESRIKFTLDRVSEDATLIADGSDTYCLPTIPGKHQDLKSITPQTLARVINQEFNEIVEKYVIVDCRYPYEFEGGHIKGAQNYFTKNAIMENLFKSPMKSEGVTKRTVIIFHCEFSSQRAPNLCRFLRATDRDINKDRYPSLFYPEVYILDGGYRDFFQAKKEFCYPQTYVPMLKDDYKKDLRKFRTKSKSWAGETQRTIPRRLLAF